MRYFCIPLIVASLLCGGCSSLIASIGTNPDALSSKEKVHEKFGEPTQTVVTADGFTETFHSRRKFRNPGGAGENLMCFAMTLGISELFCVPLELYLLTETVIVGHDFQVHYDSSGRVTRTDVDGNIVSGALGSREPTSPRTDTQRDGSAHSSR
jgi:hypothetical protein